ncbi:protein-disulfide isomerase [Sphingomonas vulcanisoli]|uniref:Protein-disulfide isomerase n=1 Tax=Sphingomonas vulcanisoli TaxID=1658060 RepID=A0ABX0TTA4_9SPHN|nr:DsbA family protein [Sphingomonas vulcanisoli]NIJ07730.1 protein-disulfide isomerase [Sphingomonas vulcanisoli]
MVTLLLAGAAGLVMGVAGSRAMGAEPQNRAAIEAIVHDYILAHPEIIPEAIGKLQNKRAADAIALDRSAIETPFAGAWAGNPHPRVTLVMFSDYSCGFCKASAGDIDRLLAETPDLKVVWREIPVLGPQSVVAARAALVVAKQGHYLAFHRGMFASSGRPDDATIARVAKASGVDPAHLAEQGKGADVDAELTANMKLAARLGVDGTPTFVIGDQIMSGAVGYDALKKAVDTARKS